MNVQDLDSINNFTECPICLDELGKKDTVYMGCCFLRVCAICERTLQQCCYCQLDLGQIYIDVGMGATKSKIRLLTTTQTVRSVLAAVATSFPDTQTQFTTRPCVVKMYEKGSYSFVHDKLSADDKYSLLYFNPDRPITERVIDGWIAAIMMAGTTLSDQPKTAYEIYRLCARYAMRYCSDVLPFERVEQRLNSLLTGGYLSLQQETGIYTYVV